MNWGDFMSVSSRLAGLGIELPNPPQAVAAYVPAVVSGSWCYTSGQIPFKDGELLAKGRVGAEVTTEQAYQAARQCALNAISVAAAAVGDINRLVRVIKVVGWVQSADHYHEQSQVINGASELLGEIFGEAGQHARSALGTNALPLDSALEVEVIFEVKL